MRIAAPPTAATLRRARSPHLAVALVGMMVAVALPGSAGAAQAGSPGSYRRSLRRIDRQLRLAIETRPAVLGEYMRSSEIICGLGERAEARGDRQESRSDWSTLSQAVVELDLPAAQAVEAALGEADSSLAALQARFSARWRRQPPKVRQLMRGVSQARRGIGSLRSATSMITAAFSAWDRRECAAAHGGIEAGVTQVSAGVDLVNLGMLRLIRLSEP